MEIVFVRHGQTDLNRSGCIQGSSTNEILNGVGREEAEKAGSNFNSKKFDVIYSSPLKRALETAEIFTHDRNDIIIDDRLKEIDFGEWDGQPVAKIEKKYPDAIDSWGQVGQSYIKYAPNGETFEELNQRCGQFLRDMADRYPNSKILVFCHGTLIRMMAAHYLTNGNMNNFETIRNCALVKFNYHNRSPRMVYYNKVLYELTKE